MGRAKKHLLAALVQGLLFCLFVGQPLVLFGEDPSESEVRGYTGPPLQHAPGENEVEWKFNADKVVGAHDAEYLEAFGNATLSDGVNTIRADFARYYQGSGWVLLKGNVRATWQGDFLEAEEAEFDLKNHQGWLKNGKVFVAKSHLYFESEQTTRRKGGTYSFKNAKITACDGERPAWSLTAREGDITLDGYVKLWHTAFNVKDVPVLYTPYAQIPAGKKRQSGFLLPSVSHSKRMGLGINLPYYWAIGPEMDATFYQNWMSSRGYMQGLEFRHAESPNSKGLWRFDWMSDSKVVKTQADQDKQFSSDTLLRPNRDRFWWRSKYDSYIGDPAWKLRADLDVVSDQQYLREFKHGPSGFEASRKEFRDRFGRDIDEIDAQNRTSTVLVMRDFEKYGVAGRIDYTQNLAYWNKNNPASQDPTAQKLPELDFFAFKNPIQGTPLEWEAEAKYDYFLRQYGTNAHRLDVKPSLSLPIQTKAVTLIPSVGVQHTQYAVTRYENEPSDTTANKTPSRTVANAGLNMFSEITRVFDVAGQERLDASKENAGRSLWTKVKHSIVPRVEYSYQSNSRRQGNLPYFNERDRLLPRDLVTYSLTNVLDRKRSVVLAVPDATGATRYASSIDYLDFMTFRLVQSFDRNEATRNEHTDQYARRPFSDLVAEVSLKPEKYLELTSRSWYSPYLTRFTEHEHLLRLTREDLGEFFFGFDFLKKIDEYSRHRDKNMSVLRLGASANLTKNFILGLEYRTDMATMQDIEKTVSATWRNECTEVQALFTMAPSDNRFEIRLRLFEF